MGGLGRTSLLLAAVLLREDRRQLPAAMKIRLPDRADAAYDGVTTRLEPAGRGMSDVQHFINGKPASGRSESSGGRWADVFNPATGERARRVALASAAEVDQAVRAARAAFPGWAA